MPSPAATPARGSRILNAMTVDVEDYFQVQAFAGVIPRADWDGIPRRVEANTDHILQAFDRAGIRATFFTLGWVAERHGALVRRIVAGGHELASHGYDHVRVDQLCPATFRADIIRTKAILEDAGGVPVRGYRAPTFSIGTRNPWAFDELAAAGYEYSSSVYPIRHDLYGMPDAPRFPFRPGGGRLWEIPMTTLRVAARNLPCAGGGYFRLLPYGVYRSGLARLNRREERPGVFYFHPWEVDPDQPRVTDAGRLARFRHYVGLRSMRARLERLLRDFRWDSIDRVFADMLTPAAVR
ncbi:XrtA system polysaccharide deacetylase [Acidisphaera rubrifaciens]|uniref:Chitooligosaccharide deacetylase n=1 Tax=Acidisphaera rubrifaciens HS-AP3 TaxID=1231350 RepID=A0A0D6P7T8_9PROT|nr:XrtA system polysaccharide deacetylase [Acidisphaera rubrifaciens]GAN77268.1 hydrolase [Acidisphaera rubrifaciens HS-AP3]